jgi:molybdopterin synthase sulfur carrier subunit
MNPECVTATIGAPDADAATCWSSSLHTSTARLATTSAGSNPSGRRCAARYPGHFASIVSGVSPCHGPASASRSRSSRITSAMSRYDAMIEAVSEARRRSLDHTPASAVATDPSARRRPTSCACWRPSAVSGLSARPCHRRTAFHSLWPWRTSSRDAGPGIPGEASAAGTVAPVAHVRLFASAREAAGTGRDDLPGDTVGEVLRAARERYGAAFGEVLRTCRVWVNGEPVGEDSPVGPHDEVAILPPVSGGAW